MRKWITLIEAARQLGVRSQTVYSYASRGQIAVMADPRDPRKSLYRSDDVAALCKRKQVGRSRETLAASTIFGGEPCIGTAITAFEKGQPYYKGLNVVRLAASAALEDVAALLLGAGDEVSFETDGVPIPGLPPGRSCAFANLAALAAAGLSTRGRTDRALHAEAAGLVGLLAQCFGAQQDAPGRPLHERFAAGWSQGPEVAEHIRKAMVLAADHEITSSAFSARITASTGASLPACLLSGLATLSGPLHGDASGRVRALFEDVQRQGAEPVLALHLRSAIPIPGFGHHLYPDGDPRASLLMADLTPPKEIEVFIRRAEQLTGLRPNIDVALAMLAAQYALPADAAFGLFATARSVGLLAHCIEQLKVEMVIRPRGRYIGPALEDANPESPAAQTPSASDEKTLDLNRIFKLLPG